MRMKINTKIRIVLYQGQLGAKIPYRDFKQIADYNPVFTVLPEYFWIRKGTPDLKSAANGFHSAFEDAAEISRHIPGYFICGTMIEPENGNYYNSCLIFKDGMIVGKHRKVHLFGNERGVLSAGDGFRLFNLSGISCGILICADVLQQSSFTKMRDLGADIIFSPTFSKLNPEDTPDDKLSRDKGIFLKGAEISGAMVGKCCSVGELFGRRANGRSLICSSKGFLYRSDELSEKRVKIIACQIEI